MPHLSGPPVDGLRILSAFDVTPSSMDSRSLQLNWSWNSTELAKRLVRKTKITHFSDVGLTEDDGTLLNDPTADSYKLGGLQPDTRYTVCIHITRDWNPPTTPEPSESDHALKSNLTRFDRTGSQVAAHLPDTTHTVTERLCRVTVTSWFHWPALISSLIGILIAVLISFSIFLYLKRAQARLKKARRDQKKVYCTDHSHSVSGKHSNTSVVIAPTQCQQLQCPYHHRCPNCHMHAVRNSVSASVVPTTVSSTSTNASVPHYHHHHHHHHQHRHRHYTHRHPVPPRVHSPGVIPLIDMEGEKSPSDSTLISPPGDLLSIDIAQSLSGSDSYQFSSTTSADDRTSSCTTQPALSVIPTRNTLSTSVTNSLSTNNSVSGHERKRTVSFLLSERRKSITDKLRSKSMDKSILESWSSKRLPFGIRKSKKAAGQHSIAEGSTTIPQVTVTKPDVSGSASPLIPREKSTPIISTVNLAREKPQERKLPQQERKIANSTGSCQKPTRIEQSSIQTMMTDPSVQSSSNSKPATLPQQTTNVLSPTLPDRDGGSVNSSVLGSDREVNEARPTVVPIALSVPGFKVAIEASPDPGQWVSLPGEGYSYPCITQT
ncbi:hypothetical protein FGIG_02163, partial [Fasciola gigantica]